MFNYMCSFFVGFTMGIKVTESPVEILKSSDVQLPVITSIRPGEGEMGEENQLSPEDIAALNAKVGKKKLCHSLLCI